MTYRNLLIGFLLALGAGASTAAPAQSTEQRAKNVAEDRRATLDGYWANVKDARDRLRDLEDAADILQQKEEDLLDNADGKRIAANSALLAEFRRIQKLEFFDRAEAKKRSLRMAEIAAVVKYAESPGAPFPKGDELKEVTDCKVWTGGKQAIVDDAAKQLSVLTTGNNKGDVANLPTLRSMIDQANRAEIVERQKLIKFAQDSVDPEAKKIVAEAAKHAELEKQKEVADELLTAQREENARMRVQFEEMIKRRDEEDKARAAKLEQEYKDKLAELDRKLKDAEVRRRVEDAAAQMSRDKEVEAANFDLLKKKCHDPEVTRLLAPLLAKGYWQPGDRDDSPTSIDSTPVSLSKLRASGALAPTHQGLAELYMIGNRTHGNRDRSVKWGFRMYSVDNIPPEEFGQLRLAQKYLNELGEALVSEKMLEP